VAANPATASEINPQKKASVWEQLVNAFPAVFALVFASAPILGVLWQFIPFSNTVKSIAAATIVAICVLAIILYLGKRQRTYRVVGNGIIIVLMVVAVETSAILVTSDTQTQIFKGFSILYFSLLPPWLYLQFIATRGKTLWDEYVLNLFRLHIDDYANLPEPPRRSAFYRGWLDACEQKRTADPRPDGAEARMKSEASLYRKKFEGLFGPVPEVDSDNYVVFRGENLLPVVIATSIIATGWVLVVKPESIFNISLLPEAFQASGLPRIPAETFRFGFLGGYFYVLQMLVR